MAEQDSNSIVIQLPWTVPQQPSVQTIVLQQPAQTHMELNASTDKTAISSFALSVVIALALGGLATWLAYWYGRKSFDLTKQSFDAVIAQIQSSERITLQSNENLFLEQQRIEKIKKTLEEHLIQKNKLKQNIASVIIFSEGLNIDIWKINDDFFNENISDKALIKNKKEQLGVKLNDLNLQIKIIQLELISSNEFEIKLEALLKNLRNELNWLHANCMLTFNQERSLKLDDTLTTIENITKQLLLSERFN